VANPDEKLVPITAEAGFSHKGLIALLDGLNVYINKGLAWIAGASLMLMVLVVVANAVMREITQPFVGTTEIVGWLAAISIAFGLGYCQLQQGYVEIDALVERFPVSLQKIVKSVMLFISMLFFVMVVWQLWLYALTVADNGNLSETMAIPYYPLIFLLAIGFGGLVLALLVDFLKEIVGSAEK